MENANKENTESVQLMLQEDSPSTSCNNNRYGWRLVENTFHAVKFTFDSVCINTSSRANIPDSDAKDKCEDLDSGATQDEANNKPDGSVTELCEGDTFTKLELEVPRDKQDTENHRCRRCENNVDSSNVPQEMTHAMQQQQNVAVDSCITTSNIVMAQPANHAIESMSSIQSFGSFVCRICHNAEHPERLVSPCLCKGSLTYVHVNCLEHWISTSGKTTCELCQFKYKTHQTLRYTCLQSLRMWYSRSMNRRTLQEDCQLFSLLTLIAFGILGTILAAIQYYLVQGKNRMDTMIRLLPEGWLIFFLFTTLVVYVFNVYMIVKGQLSPWHRWWQSAREIKLILENRKTPHSIRRLQKPEETSAAISTPLQDAHRNVPIADREVAMSTVFLNVCVDGGIDGRRNALVPIPSTTNYTSTMQINNQQQPFQQQEQQPQNEQQDQYQQDNRNQVAVPLIDI